MKGFNGSETCGVRIANAHVKGRFDVVTLGFASDRERALFVQTVSQSLAPPEVRQIFLLFLHLYHHIIHLCTVVQ